MAVIPAHAQPDPLDHPAPILPPRLRLVHLQQTLHERLQQPPAPSLALKLVQNVNVHRRPVPFPQQVLRPVHEQPLRRVRQLRERQLPREPCRGVDPRRPLPAQVVGAGEVQLDIAVGRATALEDLGDVARVGVAEGGDVRAADAVADSAAGAVVDDEAGRGGEERVLVRPDVRREARGRRRGAEAWWQSRATLIDAGEVGVSNLSLLLLLLLPAAFASPHMVSFRNVTYNMRHGVEIRLFVLPYECHCSRRFIKKNGRFAS